jgi:hypothetical protein
MIWPLSCTGTLVGKLLNARYSNIVINKKEVTNRKKLEMKILNDEFETVEDDETLIECDVCGELVKIENIFEYVISEDVTYNGCIDCDQS